MEPAATGTCPLQATPLAKGANVLPSLWSLDPGVLLWLQHAFGGLQGKGHFISPEFLDCQPNGVTPFRRNTTVCTRLKGVLLNAQIIRVASPGHRLSHLQFPSRRTSRQAQFSAVSPSSPDDTGPARVSRPSPCYLFERAPQFVSPLPEEPAFLILALQHALL